MIIPFHPCNYDDRNNQNEGYRNVYNKNDLTMSKEDGFLLIFFKLPPHHQDYLSALMKMSCEGVVYCHEVAYGN